MHLPLVSRIWTKWRAGRDASPEKADWATDSPVRVCYCGRNLAGSWTIRGLQMASARRNWAAIAEPGPRQWDSYDVFCFVKHPMPQLMADLRGLGKKVVFDVVDSWKQPEEGLNSDAASAKVLFTEKWNRLSSDAWIYPNKAMWEDFHEAFPGVVLYHHFRPGLEPAPVRERVSVVAYEGDPRFLGPWKESLSRLGGQLGFELRINPPDLREADIGFAARGGEHDCFLSNRYKSNVKLANFLGAGLPCIVGEKEVAYRETAPDGVRFVSDEATLEAVLRALLPAAERARVQKGLLAARSRFELRNVALEYEIFFSSLVRGN